MISRCSLCGGDNEYRPGDEMIACSYCGATLAIEKAEGPERLVLSHERNDALAEGALVSHLIEHERRRPTRMSTQYALVPFLMIEDGEGRITLASAASAAAFKGLAPLVPAGRYDYFDETAGRPVTVLPTETVEPGTIKILHLPVYTIRYEAGAWKGGASIIGESWQVIAPELPGEQRRAAGTGVFLASIGLFMGYLFLGNVVSNLLGRLALIAGASGGGFLLYTMHERVARRG